MSARSYRSSPPGKATRRRLRSGFFDPDDYRQALSVISLGRTETITWRYAWWVLMRHTRRMMYPDFNEHLFPFDHPNRYTRRLLYSTPQQRDHLEPGLDSLCSDMIQSTVEEVSSDTYYPFLNFTFRGSPAEEHFLHSQQRYIEYYSSDKADLLAVGQPLDNPIVFHSYLYYDFYSMFFSEAFPPFLFRYGPVYRDSIILSRISPHALHRFLIPPPAPAPFVLPAV